MENSHFQEENTDIFARSLIQMTHGSYLEFKNMKFKWKKEFTDFQEKKREQLLNLIQLNSYGKVFSDLLNLMLW